jgi:hypothetical protein
MAVSPNVARVFDEAMTAKACAQIPGSSSCSSCRT